MQNMSLLTELFSLLEMKFYKRGAPTALCLKKVGQAAGSRIRCTQARRLLPKVNGRHSPETRIRRDG
jgi:hypothetical protein